MIFIIKKAGTLTTEEKTTLGILGIPDNWPIEMYIYEDVVPDGFEQIDQDALSLLKENNQAAYDAWLQSLRPIINPVTTPQEVTVKSGAISATISGPLDSNPFAIPSYRTKRNATSDLVTVPVGESANIDFLVTMERYAAGGTLLAENAVFGDYCIASVYDKDGVIPAPYRALMCENYPNVATYIEKEWVEVSSNSISKHKIDTYPLNAKVTAGLYLRITYFAVNSGSDRRVAVNYYLTKKL